MKGVPPFPNVNFNFNPDNPVSILLCASILFLLIGLISAYFIFVLGFTFFIIGAIFLIIGLIMWFYKR